MVKRRRILLTAAVLVALVLGVALLSWLASLRPGITYANFQRIEVGHSQADVEALLGPPRDFSPNGTICWGELYNGKLVLGHQKVVWGGDAGAIVVVFDEEGSVVRKNWHDHPFSLSERMLQWLGLR
jgi:hypothetical protein